MSLRCATVSSRSAPWASLGGGLGAVLLPKCPLCFAAYGSALSALGLGPVAYSWLAEPLIAGAVFVSFGLVFQLALRRGDFATLLVSALGASLVLAGRLVLDQLAITVVGALLLVAAAVANSAQCASPTRPNP